MISDITDRLLPQIEDWQKRPLGEVYLIVFIDAVHFSVRENGQIKKLAAYVILAVSLTGHKEVLSIHIGENESAKYWLGVLNELKNRGVKDVLVICADGLSGMKGAPYQRLSSSEQTEKRISERYSAPEGSVSCNS